LFAESRVIAWRKNPQEGDMRTSSFIGVLGVALISAMPPGAFAQNPAELPCVGYATFEKNGQNSDLIGLAVGDVPADAKVVLTCTGSSCPFASKTFKMSSDVKTLALTDMFTDPTLKPGTILEIRVTKPGWIGKVFQYEVLPAGQSKNTTQCLTADGSKTVVCVKDA
jgi:hypothetical protein